MRSIFLLLLLTGFYATGFACSFISLSICEYAATQETIVLRGKIVGRGPHSSYIQILDLYQGTESRSIITLWDGIPFDCNGTFPNSAVELGTVSDTLVLALPLIPAGGGSQWQRPGDYGYDFFLPRLTQRGDSLFGLHDYNGERAYGYIALEAYLPYLLECLPGTPVHDPPIALDPPKTPSLISPKGAAFVGYFDSDLAATEIDLYDMNGRIVARKAIQDPLSVIDLTRLSPGVYIVLIKGEGIIRREKILISR